MSIYDSGKEILEVKAAIYKLAAKAGYHECAGVISQILNEIDNDVHGWNQPGNQ